jgi:hypothetical protein
VLKPQVEIDVVNCSNSELENLISVAKYREEILKFKFSDNMSKELLMLYQKVRRN